MAEGNFGDTLLYMVALVFSIVFHEVSHGFVADRHGDPTARLMGRLTLNPIPHIDPWGSILLPAILAFGHSPFLFGYAKPVPVDVRNLRNPRLDGIKVALAGPFSNILLGLLCAIVFGFARPFLGEDHAFVRLFFYGMMVNCLLAVFNLIPVPPLDGSWLLEHTLRGSAYNAYRAVRPYGMLVLIAILILPPISNLLIRTPVNYLLGLLFMFSQWIGSFVS